MDPDSESCERRMPVKLATDNRLAVVWNDDYAKNLPRDLDPLIVDEGPCNLWELVEDELMLGLPAFSYHEALDCNKLLVGISEAEPEQADAESEKPNPFNVLAQLKPGKKQ